LSANIGRPWPQAVLFDLDGTLIDSAPSIAEAFNLILARRGAPLIEANLVRKLVSRGARELVFTCLGAAGTTVDADLAEFRAVYATIKPREEHLYPGTVAMLRTLRRDARLLAICTNKPQALTEGILASLGLSECFAAVLGGDACPRPKPHPDHIHHTLAQMGLSKADAVYVGDSEVDAEAAAAAGLPFVLVTFGYTLGKIEEVVHQARIDHFDDLYDVLAKLAVTRADVG